jgi:hypothetical protein
MQRLTACGILPLQIQVIGKYAGLIGYVIPYFKKWENLESRGTTSAGRTASSRSSRSGRSYRYRLSLLSAPRASGLALTVVLTASASAQVVSFQRLGVG